MQLHVKYLGIHAVHDDDGGGGGGFLNPCWEQGPGTACSVRHRDKKRVNTGNSQIKIPNKV